MKDFRTDICTAEFHAVFQVINLMSVYGQGMTIKKHLFYSRGKQKAFKYILLYPWLE